jgi:hypothetical protein
MWHILDVVLMILISYGVKTTKHIRIKYLIYRMLDIMIYYSYTNSIDTDLRISSRDIHILFLSIVLYYIISENMNYLIVNKHDRIYYFGFYSYISVLLQLYLGIYLLSNNYYLVIINKIIMDNLDMWLYLNNYNIFKNAIDYLNNLIP